MCYIVLAIAFLSVFTQGYKELKLADLKECLFTGPDDSIQRRNYNKTREICCHQTSVHDKFDEDKEEIICCGRGTYKKNSGICCNSTFILKTINLKGRKCCGDKLLTSDAKDCCNGKEIDPKEYYCSNNKIIEHGFGFCGEVKFDKKTHSCCGKKLHDKPRGIPRKNPMYECCGSNLYNTSSEQCCRTSNPYHVQPKQSGCCGKGHYNKSTENCCRGNVFQYKQNIMCCGGEIHNTSFQDCCGGSKIYNMSQDSCCGNDILPSDKECCGSKMYDRNNNICCDNKEIIRKDKPEHNSCCSACSVPFSYNNATEDCNRDSRKMCKDKCHQTEYNPETDLCCNGMRHPGARQRGKECCTPSIYVYDKEMEICCDGIVKAKTKLRCNHRDVLHTHMPLKYKGKTTTTLVHGNSELRSGLTNLSVTRETGQKKNVHGICQICSWTSKLYMKVKTAVKDRIVDICRKSAMMVEIKSVVSVFQRKGKLKWTILNVRSYKNLYKENDLLARERDYSLIVPCHCKRLKRKKFKKFVLITNINLHKKKLYLGDADSLIPAIKNIPRLIKKRSVSCKYNLIVSKFLTMINSQH